MRGGNTMRLIPTTDWSPMSSNGDGTMNASQRAGTTSRSRWRSCAANSHACSVKMIARRCWHLADDLPRVWNHPQSSIEIRKRILRAVLKEIITDRRRSTVPGGALARRSIHTGLTSVKNRIGQNRFMTDKETVQLVGELARVLPDHSVSRSVLNRPRIRSKPEANTWNELRVRNFRGTHQIAVYRARASGRSDVKLFCMKPRVRLGINKMDSHSPDPGADTAARQTESVPGAPYVIRRRRSRSAGGASCNPQRRAVSPNERQENPCLFNNIMRGSASCHDPVHAEHKSIVRLSADHKSDFHRRSNSW